MNFKLRLSTLYYLVDLLSGKGAKLKHTIISLTPFLCLVLFGIDPN